jgi:putative hydrolase of the HAD superfamily
MPERFTGGDECRTSEKREQRWWKKAVAETFARAGYGTPPVEVVEAAFDAFAQPGAWRTYADAGRVLEELSTRGVNCGVVSNFDSRLLKVLEGLSLAPSFSSITVSSLCGFAKPAAGIFRAALREAGAGPEETLFVGDRFIQDVRGPRRAGMRSLWLVRRGGKKGPHVIGSLDRLAGMLSLSGAVKSSATRRRRGGRGGRRSS